jgi:hypothetical protein
MRRFLAMAAIACALPMLSAASEFDWMVGHFARESGAQRVHIPFFGLAQFVVAVGHPAGASSLNLAVFEHPSMDSASFSQLTDSTAGMNWKPIIRVRSKDGDATNIYARQDGKHLRLLIATLDHDDAVLVEVRIRPEELIKFVDEQKHNHHA